MKRTLTALTFLLFLSPRGGLGDERPPRPEGVALRFAWPDRVEARVELRRSRREPGRPDSVFTASFSTRAVREGARIRISTRDTSWNGDLPFPEGFARQALRASESVVEVLDVRGRFVGLDGLEAMRPVLSKILDLAEVPPDRAGRAVELALAAMRSETEELWNVQAGFWIGADLEVGETYAMQAEAAVPFLPASRARHEVRFSARRRVPCAAREAEPRCVELLLRATPEAAALARGEAEAVAALGPGAGVDADEVREVEAESEALVVAEPSTLVPHRLVWTKRLRVVWGTQDGLGSAEREDRSEYAWRYAGR
ncbi:MAG TPA: hypothetical protein VLS93_17830 [Anaeromyxobacteraceae bacterium]|nr:hypothetical protein [Anaeromyxobacteraceae bacterium]